MKMPGVLVSPEVRYDATSAVPGDDFSCLCLNDLKKAAEGRGISVDQVVGVSPGDDDEVSVAVCGLRMSKCNDLVVLVHDVHRRSSREDLVAVEVSHVAVLADLLAKAGWSPLFGRPEFGGV